MMTNKELEAIRQRAENVTEGPWFSEYGDVKTKSITDRKYGEYEYIAETYQTDADAQFIAASREDIPKLLAEIDRLKEENSRLCPIGDLDTITSLRTDIEYRNDIIKEKDAEIAQLRASVEMSKRIVGNLTRENAILKGEKPITVHLNGGDE